MLSAPGVRAMRGILQKRMLLPRCGSIQYKRPFQVLEKDPSGAFIYPWSDLLDAFVTAAKAAAKPDA